MKITRNLKIAFASLIIILSALTAWFFLQNKNDKHGKDNDVSADSHSRVRVDGGITTIELSATEQTNSGITTVKLAETLHRSEVTAYGSVVSVQDISRDVQNFEAGKAQLAKAKENFLLSRKNFDRIKSLYEKNLASEQDFQSAQAAFLSDQADENSAQSNLNSLKSSIVEQWGDEISRWIFNGTSQLQRILSLDDKLIQISFPPDETDSGNSRLGSTKSGQVGDEASRQASTQKQGKIPGKIYVQTATGNNKKISCRFVSAGHLTNLQFQTSTLYYISSDASLNAGMNVKAFLPVGKELEGVFVPDSSVVWWQGKTWIYVEKSPGKFIRVGINTDNKSGDNYFVPQNQGIINPEVRVVKSGAQLLLSEEFHPQVQKGGGGDND